MITKELNIKKYCCFYVSEFHLEMILLPYIRKNIDNSKIIIFTQENLKDTVTILLDRINCNSEEKNKILNLHYWDNKKIENFDFKKVSIVDCYNAEKIDLNAINKKYDYKLNTADE